MEVSAYRALSDRFGAQRTAPRAWLAVGSLARIFRVEREADDAVATGILGIAGLTAQEAQVVGPQKKLVAGRWLAEGEEDACLLPLAAADSLGIDRGDLSGVGVRLFGETFRVVGLLANDALDALDLNGEPLTPLDPEAQRPTESKVGAGQGGQGAVFTHLPASSVVVVPYVAAMRWDKARLVSVAIRFAAAEEELAELAETLDLNLFVGRHGRQYDRDSRHRRTRLCRHHAHGRGIAGRGRRLD